MTYEDFSGAKGARDRTSIQTFTGKLVNPLALRVEDVSILDIAHSLAQQCRFTGHTLEFYSTSQHSVGVSRLCDPADALAGLIHDGSEAYLSDIARPVKRSLSLDSYRLVEHNLEAVIYEAFGLPL